MCFLAFILMLGGGLFVSMGSTLEDKVLIVVGWIMIVVGIVAPIFDGSGGGSSATGDDDIDEGAGRGR